MIASRTLVRALLALAVASSACREGGTEPSANQAPVVAASIPPMVTTEGHTVVVDVLPYFTDPDGDTLSYEVATTDTAVVRVTLSGSLATAAAGAEGTATLTVTARDPGGLSVSQSIDVTVRPNHAPMATGTIPAVDLASGEIVEVDVSRYFTDSDGGALIYEASSSNTRVAAVSVSWLTMSVSGVAAWHGDGDGHGPGPGRLDGRARGRRDDCARAARRLPG